MLSESVYLIFTISALLIGLLWGMATVQYRIFPYQVIRYLKRAVVPDLRFNPYFYDRVCFFEQHGSEFDVVMIGDSLTDMAEWHELFPEVSIANRGINGDRTDGVLLRMDGIRSTSASKAFVMIGFNDQSADVELETILSNYRQIVSLLKDHGMQVYIQSVLFASESRAADNVKIEAINQRLRLFEVDDEQVVFIDLNERLAPNSKLEPTFTTDGIHLNGLGYQHWREAIEGFMG